MRHSLQRVRVTGTIIAQETLAPVFLLANVLRQLNFWD